MSSESNLREAKTIPSISYVEQFFKEIPTDNRFGSVNWKKIGPKTGVSTDTKQYVFELSRQSAPNCYLVLLSLY
jgi:hypothetical protein